MEVGAGSSPGGFGLVGREGWRRERVDGGEGEGEAAVEAES